MNIRHQCQSIKEASALVKARVAWQIVAALTLCVTSIASYANVPRPTLAAPSGSITQNSITYRWSAEPSANHYQLLVVRSDRSSFRQWYSPAELGCDSPSDSTCSITRQDNLPEGASEWRARISAAEGLGAWTRAMRFTVNHASTPTQPISTIYSPQPNQPVRSRQVLYRWEPVSDAISYEVKVTDAKGNIHTDSYKLAALTCARTCELVRKESLPSGRTEFQIRAKGRNGTLSTWSPARNFLFEYRRQLLIGETLPGKVEKNLVDELTFTDGIWVKLSSRQRNSVSLLVKSAKGRVLCDGGNSLLRNCVFKVPTNGSIEIINKSRVLADYFISLLGHPPECFKPASIVDTTYLAAKFRTRAEISALTNVGNNVCTDSAYYKTVDPRGQRKTLDGWLRTNHFLIKGSPTVVTKINRKFLKADVVNAEYHNMLDLGFGRDMYCKVNGATHKNYPCVVQNYAISSDLTVANPQPAKLVVSVTMELSPPCINPTLTGNCRYTAFYVYDDEGRRINSVELDGKGRKSIPEVCLSCHSGTYKKPTTIFGRPQISGGTYLPFYEKLFGHFKRDLATLSGQGYTPPANVGIVSLDSRKLNKLLKPLLPTRVDTAGIPHDGDIQNTAYGIAHPKGSFQAETRRVFCEVCHVAVKGDFALYKPTAGNSTASNCQMCHDSAAGGGPKTRLERHLCEGGLNSIRMPNSLVTHRAMYDAWQGTLAPYASFNTSVSEFVDAVCNGASLATPPGR